MIHNWYNLDWWKNSSCTIEEMKKVLTSQIVLDHYPRIDEKDKNKTNIGGVVSNYVCNQIKVAYQIYGHKVNT